MKKQQTSLLSFFSPPSGSKPLTAKPSSATKAGNGTAKGTATCGALPAMKMALTNRVLGPVDAGGKGSTTRKRIDFSPKASRKEASEAKDAKPPSSVKQAVPVVKASPVQKKSTDDGEAVDSSKSAEKTPTKRKGYEDFLGTSSEEESEGKSKETPRKRLRRTPVKVIVRDDSDSDEEMPEPPAAAATTPSNRRKASRRVEVSSEEEWDGAKDEEESEFSGGEEDEATDDDDDDDEVDEEEEEEEIKPRRGRKGATTNKKTTAKASAAKSSLQSPQPRSRASPSKANAGFSSPMPSTPQKTAPSPGAELAEAGAAGVNGVFGAGNHIHDSLPWLNDKRRDINGNKPDSPDYDPRTVYIPPEFLKKETPAMVQWWEVKARNMDTVLFFKVGKFYELFHMDADIGFKELGLIYMKGEKAHSGFPEIAYSKMSSQLVAKGYRVARVEQTETPEMLKERNSTSAKKAKVVRREICSMLSPGTNTISFLDAPMKSQSDVAAQLLAIKERAESKNSVRLGVCLVDCATGAFQLGEFDDSEQRDRLQTLLAQHHVVEIVSERGGLSDDTKTTLKHGAPGAVRSELRVGKEFWDANSTINEIERAGYFQEQGWPEQVQALLNIDKTPKDDAQLAISAFGGCIWHLRRSIIDHELVSLCNFERYRPADEEAKEQRASVAACKGELNQQYVVLDAQTIQNLEILQNNFNGTRSGSLIDIMDKTVTHFGKRMFQDWVLKPLCKVADINARLDAVQELTTALGVVDDVRSSLRKLPDIERILSRIHALGSSYRSKEHPDSRAIMYEANTYNIRKIRDFLSVLHGFEASMELLDRMAPRFEEFESPILRGLLKQYDPENTANASSGQFPALHSKLAFFKRSFDQEAAQKSGVIVPQEGVDPDYDGACTDITNIEQEFQEYLEEQRRALKCKQVVYWATKKKEDRYQLEVPESACSKQPKEYELKSRKKGYKRFHTPTIRDLLAQLAKAEERKEIALKDQMRRIFHKFDEDYRHWMKAVQCLAVLDCLLSLAHVSAHNDGYVRPELVSAATDNGGAPFIDIGEGVHPCVAASFDGGDFIPNDTRLGLDKGKGRMIVLSGPNMGGKSTLLRQTCVLALMAQIGCFVPAVKCRMSPVDRIFTRIGASDRILAGQSTLYVELAETATILNHATTHSLVILDELGRGTSTFDGTAIAYSVIEHLLREVQCRALFATHYHSLVEEYLDDDKVLLGHMGCLVDPENDNKVTFLYKFADGMCPKSYGLNVAMLAKLPDEVVECAARKSEQFETALQANSHVHLEATKIAQHVQDLLAQEPVDQQALQALWKAARALVA
ncbi:TPA: hypothetical protein N0F65_010755 [Lagenidium giganteum]|uniref:DNA mismatch repair protein n=1 Tax=Lagenidium giganteum TaxID=4803 RepID=A0AAV2YSQ7_9STRA|nr:TPA: hypothetical protein N0F65_010755 [Lagenidium giganteum]